MRTAKALESIKQHSLLLASFLVVAAALFLLFRIILPSLGHMTHGFPAYYTASRLLVENKMGPQVYDDAWFAGQVHSAINEPIDEILTPTLPTASLLATPLILLSPQTARDTWIWLSLIALLIGLGLLVITDYHRQQNSLRPALWLAIVAFGLVFPPVAANLFIGQFIILFFCLLALSFFGLVSQRDWLAGLALGLAFILKLVGMPLWLLFIVQRRWKALGWGGGTIVAVVLFSLPWIGISTWGAYIQAAWGVSSGPTVAVSAYQTTAGLFAHLFQFDPTWNQNPITHWPMLANVLPLLVAVTAILVTLWVGRNSGSVAKLFAALVPLGVVLLPVAEEHHFVLLLIPIFILTTEIYDQLSARALLSRDSGLLGIALVLLVVPILPQSTRLNEGWLAVLAYPRLYGAWLIWFIAIRQMAAAQPHADQSPTEFSISSSIRSA